MQIQIAATLAIALAGTTPAAAQVEPQDKAFETALAAQDLMTAADSLDRLIVARLPESGKPAPDPYLNHRIGRFLLAAGHSRAALPWLEAATESTTSVPAHAVALDQARALVLVGEAKAALPLIDTALRDVADPVARNLALRLRIDALLATDPVAAVAALAAAADARASDPRNEWDWALLDARAALLTGAPSASSKARHAWNSAIGAPIAASAPARAAAMLAMVEERAGNRAGALAMMAAASRNEPDVSAITKGLSAILPNCGSAVTNADHVTVSLHRDSVSGATRLSAISASRPAVVAQFLSGVNASEIMGAGALNTAATIARLRCRVSPTSDFIAQTSDRDPASVFMARRGLFPRFGYRGDGEAQLNAASQEVDALTTRYGTDSPLLLFPLIRLVALSHARLTQSGDIPPTRLIDLSDRLGRVATAAGDTAAFLPVESNFYASFARALRAPTREAAGKIMTDSFSAFLAAVDLSIAFANLTGSTEGIDPVLVDATRAQLAARAAKALPPGDPRLVALRFARVAAARTAADGSLAARIRETALPGDLCALQPVIPRLRSTTMSDDDYPSDALIGELTGRTTLEFDLDPSGRPRAPRTIIALPPILFDEVIARQTAGIVYYPAEANSRAIACRAMSMAIRWKMPEQNQEIPGIIPDSWGPGS